MLKQNDFSFLDCLTFYPSSVMLISVLKLSRSERWANNTILKILDNILMRDSRRRVLILFFFAA